jgi:hypothetical protein
MAPQATLKQKSRSEIKKLHGAQSSIDALQGEKA